MHWTGIATPNPPPVQNTIPPLTFRWKVTTIERIKTGPLQWGERHPVNLTVANLETPILSLPDATATWLQSTPPFVGPTTDSLRFSNQGRHFPVPQNTPTHVLLTRVAQFIGGLALNASTACFSRFFSTFFFLPYWLFFSPIASVYNTFKLTHSGCQPIWPVVSTRYSEYTFNYFPRACR